MSGGFIEKLAGPLKATPYRIAITGHTWASKTPSRAGVRALEPFRRPRQRYPPDPRSGGHAFGQLLRRAGRADTDPLLPDDPFIAANRRVTISLMREGPPGPAGSQAPGGRSRPCATSLP